MHDLTPEHGFGWNEGRVWGAMLDDVATIERVEPEELAPAEEPAPAEERAPARPKRQKAGVR